MSIFNEVRLRTKEIEITPSLEGCKKLILSVVKLLDASIDTDNLNLFELFTDDGRKLAANASWFLSDTKVKDHKATYQVHEKNNLNIDFKLFGVQNTNKRIISWSQALTPNFEDEPFYEDLRIGIDFIVPKTLDRVSIALSNSYAVRILELHGNLTTTFEEIFAKWQGITDYSNKRLVHTILWESFDLHPINKKFYEGVSTRFVNLVQHMEASSICNRREATQFANRLIGRIVFCWFVRKKGFIDDSFGYFDSRKYENDSDYYHERLETLFFRVLNCPREDRVLEDLSTPFLNGGLFEERPEDFARNSKLTFPANYFDDFYDFLGTYNFTTDESTSQFQQVAIDPEMLGRIFENLLAEIVEDTGEQARRAKGAFYTPREIVDFMCKEALLGYLKQNLPFDANRDQRLSQLIEGRESDFQDQDHNWRRDWKPYKEDILAALDSLRFIDPACGSGAFPMGMLQLLLKVYERLEPRFDSYKSKLQIIEKNLFGVDIEPMAVEISRLRAWLSLVVDLGVDPKSVTPLPNLDFKFVCANSLVPLNSVDSIAFGEDPELALKLQLIREKYFSTQNFQKKDKLKHEYAKSIKEEESLFGESARTAQLKTYRPFETGSTSLFFDSVQMFGVEKFDIVIANPPYVSALVAKRSTPASVRESYKVNYVSANGAYDLYILFFELGMKLLNPKGTLVYISPRKYLSALYAESFRSKMGVSRLTSIVDFSDDRVFDSAGVSTMISVFQNSPLSNSIEVKIYSNAAMTTLDYSCNHDRSTLTRFPQGSWGFLITKDFEFLVKAHSSQIKFENVLGVNSSSTAAEGDEFKIGISENPSTLKMVNTGNLGPWVTRWGSVKYSNGKEKLIKPYLDENLPNQRRLDMYRSEKIIIGKLAKKIIASIDELGEFASSNTTFVYEFSSEYSIWLVGAILNSNFINKVYRAQFAGLNMPGDSYQFQAPQIRLLPLPRIDKSNIVTVHSLEKLCKVIVEARRSGVDLSDQQLESNLETLEILVQQLYLGAVS